MWQIIVIIFCLLLNGLLAATECAFIAMSKPRLRKLAAEGNDSAKRVLALREIPEKTLSILQLGITFIGVLAAAVGGEQVGSSFALILQKKFGWTETSSVVLAILLFVVPYTYLNIVISELLPKSIALRNPKWVIFHMDRWLIILGKMLSPIVLILEKSTKGAAKVFFSWVKQEEVEHEEMVLVSSRLEPYVMKLATFERKTVVSAMIPWQETDTIGVSYSIDEVKKVLLQTGHTRVPVVDQKGPMGILFSKEFFSFLEQKKTDWSLLLRPLISLNEADSLLHGLKVMQKAHSHLSIVFHENTPIGIVTIEDILEEVVGEIYEEDDLRVSERDK